MILKLKEKGFGNTDDEIVFFYANISDYLYKLVTNNPTAEIQNRTCTQKEIFEYLKNGKNLIFNSSFREYQGEQKYFTFIKNQHFSSRNIDYYERFIIVELIVDESIADIKEIVFKIKDKFYNKSGALKFQRIKSPAPYIYLKNISDESLIQLKTELSKENIIFKDGFDFAGADFSLDSIKQDTTIHNNLCLKLVNNESILQKLVIEDFQNPKEIFQFYTNENVAIKSDIKNTEIQIKNISDINFIL